MPTIRRRRRTRRRRRRSARTPRISLDDIDRLGLDVETIIPVHYAADGRKVTRAELTRFVSVGTN